MGNYQNELEQFIYEVCFQSIWEEAARYISEHPYALDLSRARIKYPTSAYLENMAIEFTCNIHIVEAPGHDAERRYVGVSDFHTGF